MNESPIRCRCIWHGVECDKDATQEDGLCDWCGDRRPEDLRDNPFAMWSDDGKFLGLAGGTVTGYNHQAGWGPIPDSVRPTACWLEARLNRASARARDEVLHDPRSLTEIDQMAKQAASELTAGAKGDGADEA